MYGQDRARRTEIKQFGRGGRYVLYRVDHRNKVDYAVYDAEAPGCGWIPRIIWVGKSLVEAEKQVRRLEAS